MHLCGQRKGGREKCFIVLACFDTIYSQVLGVFFVVFFAASGGLKISPCESSFFFGVIFEAFWWLGFMQHQTLCMCLELAWDVWSSPMCEELMCVCLSVCVRVACMIRAGVCVCVNTMWTVFLCVCRVIISFVDLQTLYQLQSLIKVIYQAYLPNICWFRLLKCEDLLLFCFTSLEMNFINSQFEVLVRQSRWFEDAIFLWGRFLQNLIKKIVDIINVENSFLNL